MILFPLVNLKSANFFTKFNALGTVSILFILSSVLFRCYHWGLHVNFSDPASEEFIPMFKSSFPRSTASQYIDFPSITRKRSWFPKPLVPPDRVLKNQGLKMNELANPGN